MQHMRTIKRNARCTSEVLHIEAPGCIVNIFHLLKDTEGRSVTAVEVILDDGWSLPDFEGRRGINVRVRDDRKKP